MYKENKEIKYEPYRKGWMEYDSRERCFEEKKIDY